MRFFQRGTDISEALAQMTELVGESAAHLLCVPLEENLTAWAAQFKDIEHRADLIAHAIAVQLEKTFIPVFDREDIERLVQALDDIIDNIEEAANRRMIFRLMGHPQPLDGFANLLVRAASRIREGMQYLRKKKHATKEFAACYRDIHTIENEGDHLHHKVLGDLFGTNDMDLRKAIEWDKVYQALEDALDRCEDVAKAFEHMRAKYA